MSPWKPTSCRPISSWMSRPKTEKNKKTWLMIFMSMLARGGVASVVWWVWCGGCGMVGVAWWVWYDGCGMVGVAWWVWSPHIGT